MPEKRSGCHFCRTAFLTALNQVIKYRRMSKREEIFDAAAKLFVERSYNSVGIRDIAREAGVNSAMISYYFGGKANLLREIFSKFADLIHEHYDAASQEASGINDLVDKSVDSLIRIASGNLDVFMVGLRELNSDSPELEDLREEIRERGQRSFSDTLARLGIPDTMPEQEKEILHDAALGAIFSDLLLGGKKHFDPQSKRKDYAKIVSGMLKNGVADLLT
jgi:AcrR family transcriptional regulator